ncbi:MAG: hypothetical protein JW904_02395 [Spirochaetales bacterium]|nr:hypothetical protein [Spirochaetales bacterium]
MKRFLIIFLLSVVFSSSWLAAQQKPIPVPAAEEPKKERDFKTMVQDTLDKDIETASYYELVSWCSSLKLETTGDKQTLQQRLRTFYSVQTSQKPKQEDQRIEIQSAQNSEYFSIDEIDENYIHIRGGVSVVLTDKKTNTEHTINAEQILYNQSKSIISASGNIHYTRKQGESSEVFRGESFIFDVSNWEGILYLAQGERKKEVENTSLLFVYSGTAISRMKDDTIIIENGVITSSKNIENPNYRITASKIWVFGPGEWAIQDAVLFVGHIPTLYFPFYYYSADEIFFNPVVGFKLREGAFLQNTIYLIGNKTKDENPLSFLPVESSAQTQQKYVLDGLYLRPAKTSPAVETAPDSPDTAAAIKHFKIYADIYSRLGFFTGLSFDMSPAISVKGGLGISRSIFYGTSGYTPYYSGDEYWNSSYLFGIPTFFRYGLETSFDWNWGIVEKISGQFNLFSDPYFTTDFYSRDETQDWGKIAGFELPTLPSSTTTVSTTQNNLNWSLNSRINFAGLVNSALFRPFEISTFSLAFDWGKKDVANLADPVVAADPARTFYYPQRIIFPNVSFLSGGSILNYSNSNEVKVSAAKKTQNDPGTGLESPQQKDEELPTAESPDTETADILKPDTRQNSIITRTMKYFTFSLSYSLAHNFKMEHVFDQELWTTVDDINFKTKSSNTDVNGNTSLTYKLSLLNSMWDIAGGFTFLDKYKTTYLPSIGFDPTLQDYQYTGLTFSKNVLATYRPFLPWPDFNTSSISYNVKWNYFDLYYDTAGTSFASRLFQWERDTVSLQQVNMNLIYKPEDKINSLKTIYTIPPALGRFFHELSFYLWIFQTIATLEYKEQTDTTWRFEPANITEKATYENIFSFTSVYRYDIENQEHLDLVNDLFLLQYKHNEQLIYLFQQELDYDFIESMFSKSNSVLTLWDLKLSFLAQKMFPVNSIGNKTGGIEEFVPYLLSAVYNVKSDNIYFWKDRIIFYTNINSSLNINFQKYIASNLTIQFQFGFKIHEFHELVFSLNMYNNNIYRYIPAFVDAVNDDASQPPPFGYSVSPGITTIDPLSDFLKSINFFNEEDRYDSFFKLKSIALDYIHYLEDWTFKLSYSGEFKLQLLTDGTSQYEWIPAFSFSVKWLPIPEIKNQVTGDNTGIQF